jgi:hypothetical protein
MTVLNPDFVTSELDKFDVYSVVADKAKTLLPSQQFIDAKTVDDLVTKLRPWFEEQANTVIHAVYAYIEEDRELSVTISLEPVRAAVKENARESVINSLPPELQGASQSQIDAYMSQIYTGIDNVIPSSFVLNEGVAGSQIMTQLEQVKKIVGYIDTAYKALIAAAVLLVLLIALVYWWQPKPITRSIGITFTLVGVACILGPLLDYLIVQVLNQFIGTSGLTSGIQAKLPQLVADLTVPVRMYGIGFLGSGVVLVAISFLFRSPESRPDAIKTY